MTGSERWTAGQRPLPLLEYDDRAIREIHAWKNPEIGWFGQAMKLVNWPLDKAGDLFLASPGLGDVIRRSVQGLTSVCNDVAQWSVRPEAIYEDFRKAVLANMVQ